MLARLCTRFPQLQDFNISMIVNHGVDGGDFFSDH